MNRFFSKLDLRDIKINPEGSRFPPDAEEVVETHEPAPEEVTDAVQVEATGAPVIGQPARQPHIPAWADAPASAVPTPPAPASPASLDDLVAHNGHDGAKTNGLHAVDEETGDTQTVHSGDVLKVSARSRPSAVAGAIAGVVREAGRAEVQAIGAGATNQAVKAVAIARDYLRETGIEAICLPAFIDVTIENEDRTAIRLVVEPR